LTIGQRALPGRYRLELALLESAANRTFLKKGAPKTFYGQPRNLLGNTKTEQK